MHSKFLLLNTLLFISYLATAQIQLLNDEFNQTESIINWKNINETESWGIQQLENYDINTTRTGHLQMMPYTVTWFEGYRGPLIYKEVTGDFVFTGGIAISGRSGGFPTSNFQFNLAGVMCRIPMNYPNGALGANGWQDTDQNYIFLAIGGANDGDGRCDPNPSPCLAPHLEVKTTINGQSVLDIQDIDAAEAQFRFARIGSVFIIMYKLATSSDWVIHRRYERNDFPETVQIGFVTYTNWPKVFTYTPVFHNSHTLNNSLVADPSNNLGLAFDPDVIGDFDFARFDSLSIPPGLEGSNFFNPMSISDEALLAFLAYDSDIYCPTNLHIHSEIDSNAYVQIQANEQITMDTTVLTKSSVLVNAGITIQLLPGFEVATGTNFTASIGGCSGNAFQENTNKFSSHPLTLNTTKVIKEPTLNITPNPFLYETEIRYHLDNDEKVSLKIYDINGRLVTSLLNQQFQKAGTYTYQFQPNDTQGNIFYMVLQTETILISRQLIRIW